MPRRRVHRRDTGSVRQLKSGRWQARFVGPDGQRRAAPGGTFATKQEADAWIASQIVDVNQGSWRAPELGDEPLRHYFERWLADNTKLRARTRDLYRRIGDRYVLAKLE